jgi:hypothetical protein
MPIKMKRLYQFENFFQPTKLKSVRIRRRTSNSGIGKLLEYKYIPKEGGSKHL